MSVLAVVASPNDSEAPCSAPRRIVSELTDIQIDVVHFGREELTAVPYLWVRQVSPTAFESALKADPTILSHTQLDTNGDDAFYKARWEVDSPLIKCLLEAGGVILDAHGSKEDWTLKLWFEEQSLASTFQQCCSESNVPLEIKRLSSILDEYAENARGLTIAQQETVQLAFNRGYYDEPRAVSLDDLATELEISTNAVGRLLRRGHRNLVEQLLLDNHHS